MKRFRRIMHASDFSPASRPAFAQAVELAAANKARLVVVHAAETMGPYLGMEDTYVSARAHQAVQRAARAQAQRSLDRLVARARAARVRATGSLVEGNPWQAIVREAKRDRADLLVIGTHGRTGLKKIVLGSVAARVVAQAPCPVLTVRRGAASR